MLVSINLIKPIISSESNNEVESEMSQNINMQLDSIDFSNLDKLIENAEESFIFKNNNFKDVVKEIINGNYFSNYPSIFSSILSIIFYKITEYIPILLIIIAVCIITQLLLNFKNESNNTGITNTINIVSLSVVVVTVIKIFVDVFKTTSGTLQIMEKQSEIILPILLTLLASVGSVISANVIKPVIAVYSSVISLLFTKLIFPIFIFTFIIAILKRLSNQIKLDKLFNFSNSLFKWVIGFVFTIFSALLTIQGISAGKYDNISFKTTKFAIKSYVPIVGSYIGDGLDLIVLCSVLIKNSIGLVGLFLIGVTVLSPIINFIVLKLLLQLTSSILELLGDSKISGFIEDCAKILIYPIIIILSVAFMYLLSVGLIICTANIIWFMGLNMSWLYNVVGIIFLGIIFESLLPVNRINKFIKSIFAIFVVYALITPFLKITNTIDLSDSFSSIDSSLNNELLNSINNIKNETYSNIIEKSLLNDNIMGVSVEITNIVDKNEYEIANVYINISNLVLNEYITNINKYEVITKHVKNIINVSEDKIIFYE